MSDILKHVVLAGENKPKKAPSFHMLDGRPLDAKDRPLIDINHSTFKKLPGEKEQLKELKKEFFSKNKTTKPRTISRVS